MEKQTAGIQCYITINVTMRDWYSYHQGRSTSRQFVRPVGTLPKSDDARTASKALVIADPVSDDVAEQQSPEASEMPVDKALLKRKKWLRLFLSFRSVLEFLAKSVGFLATVYAFILKWMS